VDLSRSHTVRASNPPTACGGLATPCSKGIFLLLYLVVAVLDTPVFTACYPWSPHSLLLIPNSAQFWFLTVGFYQGKLP
jgi:hypothetical protein